MFPSIFGEHLFDDFFNDDFRMLPMASGHSSVSANGLMRTDVRELDSTYELDVDLPGFKKEEVSLDLKDGYLTISARKDMSTDESDQKGRYVRRERYNGVCSRSFYIGEEVKSSDVSAKFEDGILKITLPKQEKKALPGSTSIAIE